MHVGVDIASCSTFVNMAGNFQNIPLPDTQVIKQVSRDQLKLQLQSVCILHCAETVFIVHFL